MIEGQEDVTWDDWVAIAEACERSGIGTLFRSDHYLSVEDRRERGSLDALDDAGGARRDHREAAAGDDGLAGDLPPSLRLRQVGGDGRPDQRRPGRARGSAPGGGTASTRPTASTCRSSGRGWTPSKSSWRSSPAALGGRRLQLRRGSLQGRRVGRAAEAAAAADAADHRRLGRAAQPADRGALGRRVQHRLRRPGGAAPSCAPSSTRRARSGPRPGVAAAVGDDRLDRGGDPRRGRRPRRAAVASGRARTATARRFLAEAATTPGSPARSTRRSSSCAPSTRPAARGSWPSTFCTATLEAIELIGREVAPLIERF